MLELQLLIRFLGIIGSAVVMIDQNSNISYLGCGTALWVGRQIDLIRICLYKKNFENKGRPFTWRQW